MCEALAAPKEESSRSVCPGNCCLIPRPLFLATSCIIVPVARSLLSDQGRGCGGVVFMDAVRRTCDRACDYAAPAVCLCDS